MMLSSRRFFRMNNVNLSDATMNHASEWFLFLQFLCQSLLIFVSTNNDVFGWFIALLMPVYLLITGLPAPRWAILEAVRCVLHQHRTNFKDCFQQVLRITYRGFTFSRAVILKNAGEDLPYRERFNSLLLVL
jgi:hypothetical protein